MASLTPNPETFFTDHAGLEKNAMISLLNENEPTDPNVLSYINRLSDYLFVLARKLSFDLKAEEIKWIPEKKG